MAAKVTLKIILNLFLIKRVKTNFNYSQYYGTFLEVQLRGESELRLN